MIVGQHLFRCIFPRVAVLASLDPSHRDRFLAELMLHAQAPTHTHTRGDTHIPSLSMFRPFIEIYLFLYLSLSSSPSLKLCISRTIASALALAVSHARSLSFPPCISLTYSLLFLSHPSHSSALPRSISLFFSPPGSLALSFVPLYLTPSRFFLCSKIGSDVVHIL